MPKITKDFKKDFSSRTWFLVINNPQNVFGNLHPEELVQTAIDTWIDGHDERTCAANYEVADTGTPHIHMVCEGRKMRFSAIKKIFPTAHIEATQGTKEDAEDYINKKGKFSEKAHTLVVPPIYHGEIKAKPRGGDHSAPHGMKKAEILEAAQAMINAGSTPEEIMDAGGIQFRQYDTLIQKAYFAKRKKETPPYRKVTTYYHIGESGSGKSHTYLDLCEEKGEDKIYMMTDFSNSSSSFGGLDHYNGEPILFMDEFRPPFSYSMLLQMLDGYKIEIHARYANTFALWTEVHITTILPPETLYNLLVPPDQREVDPKVQLFRRLDIIVYHWIDNEKYKTYEMSMKSYKDYADLIRQAHVHEIEQLGFIELQDND